MTDPKTLLASTGHARADDALRALAAAGEGALPGRLRSVYVTGSYADETALASSDLDVTLVFAGRLTAEERALAEDAVAGVAQGCGVELDASVADENKLAHGVPPLLGLGGRCVWGEDHREAMPLVPIERWVRERMHNAYALIVTIFRRPTPLELPLLYPDAGDEFFGYTHRTVRLPDGAEVPSTRDLIRVTGWAATALVALHGRVYVVRKREMPVAYRQHVGGEHATLHEDIARWCREQWSYLIPDDAAGRALLRDVCARALAFENHYLGVYREWLLGELRSPDNDARQAARRMLGRMPLADDEIAVALEQVDKR